MSGLFAVGLAIWDTGPAVYLRAHDLPRFEERGFNLNGGRTFDVRVGRRTVTLTPSADGRGRHIGIAGERELLGEYLIQFVAPYICRAHVFKTTARWWDEAGERLVVDLPEPHELPYPRIGFHRDEANHDMVVRDLRARMASALAKTGSPKINVDRRFQDHLTPAERVSLFTTWSLPEKQPHGYEAA